jgi:hypothetical protein
LSGLPSGDALAAALAYRQGLRCPVPLALSRDSVIFELVAQFDQPAIGLVDRDAEVIGQDLDDVFIGWAGEGGRFLDRFGRRRLARIGKRLICRGLQAHALGFRFIRCAPARIDHCLMLGELCALEPHRRILPLQFLGLLLLPECPGFVFHLVDPIGFSALGGKLCLLLSAQPGKLFAIGLKACGFLFLFQPLTHG